MSDRIHRLIYPGGASISDRSHNTITMRTRLASFSREREIVESGWHGSGGSHRDSIISTTRSESLVFKRW
jgi:hypothetical protein